MHRAVRPEDRPDCLANPSADLQEPLAAVEWLVVFAAGPAPPAGHLKNAQVGDAAKVFAHEAVPRAGGVFVLGRRVVKSLTPSVVLSPQAHALSHTPQALPWPFAKPFSFDHPRTHR